MFYRLHDKNPNGAFPINEKDAPYWNSQQYGIFKTINNFSNSRKITDLVKINAYAVDIDTDLKSVQMKGLYRGLPPSKIVETKRGYQVYFNVSDGTVENHKTISKSLIEFYNADKNASDISRILRVPGFYHWKGEPFLIKLIYSDPEIIYTESQLLHFYDIFIQKEEKLSKNINNERIFSLDCEYALRKLSGKSIVNYEIFSFKHINNGNLNILVNGKQTSCWVDKNKMIGSHDKGGPSIYQWLQWYGHNKKTIMEELKKEFPECF